MHTKVCKRRKIICGWYKWIFCSYTVHWSTEQGLRYIQLWILNGLPGKANDLLMYGKDIAMQGFYWYHYDEQFRWIKEMYMKCVTPRIASDQQIKNTIQSSRRGFADQRKHGLDQVLGDILPHRAAGKCIIRERIWMTPMKSV